MLVAGDNEGGFKRGNFVQVGDPLCSLSFTGFGGHHVHFVVSEITGDDRSQRWEIDDGGLCRVGLTDLDDPDLVAFELDVCLSVLADLTDN